VLRDYKRAGRASAPQTKRGAWQSHATASGHLCVFSARAAAENRETSVSHSPSPEDAKRFQRGGSPLGSCVAARLAGRCARRDRSWAVGIAVVTTTTQRVTFLSPPAVCAGAVCRFHTDISHSALAFLTSTLAYTNGQLREEESCWSLFGDPR